MDVDVASIPLGTTYPFIEPPKYRLRVLGLNVKYELFLTLAVLVSLSLPSPNIIRLLAFEVSFI